MIKRAAVRRASRRAGARKYVHRTGAMRTRESVPPRWQRRFEKYLIEEGYSRKEAKELIEVFAS